MENFNKCTNISGIAFQQFIHCITSLPRLSDFFIKDSDKMAKVFTNYAYFLNEWSI